MTAVEKEIPGPWNVSGDRRHDLLLRLASNPQNLSSVLPRAVEARLTFLLTEIDENVLPRQLHLQAGTEEVARLIVSNRRLTAVEMPGRIAPSPDMADLPALFASRLVEIAESRAELSFTISRRLTTPLHAEPACSVAALDQALGLATTRNAFDRLLRQIVPQSLAHLVWSPENARPHFSGALEWASALQALADHHRRLTADHKADARVGPLRTEGMAIPVSATLVLVLATLDRAGLAAILPRKQGLDLVASWQAY